MMWATKTSSTPSSTHCPTSEKDASRSTTILLTPGMESQYRFFARSERLPTSQYRFLREVNLTSERLQRLQYRFESHSERLQPAGRFRTTASLSTPSPSEELFSISVRQKPGVPTIGYKHHMAIHRLHIQIPL